jgi:hypothetical protein
MSSKRGLEKGQEGGKGSAKKGEFFHSMADFDRLTLV